MRQSYGAIETKQNIQLAESFVPSYRMGCVMHATGGSEVISFFYGHVLRINGYLHR